MVRRMFRFVDGQPWSIQDSSYPMDIAQECGLLVPHDIPRGTVRAMADHGHVEIGYVDEITARMPTPEETRTLDLGAGVPMLIYVRTAYTKERPVRLTETTFAGDRNRLLYELGELDASTKRGLHDRRSSRARRPASSDRLPRRRVPLARGSRHPPVVSTVFQRPARPAPTPRLHEAREAPVG